MASEPKGKSVSDFWEVRFERRLFWKQVGGRHTFRTVGWEAAFYAVHLQQSQALLFRP